MTKKTEITPEDKWKHRRRMAYGAFAGGLGFPFLVIQNSELTEIAMPFYAFVGAVVGAFIGFATAEKKWDK